MPDELRRSKIIKAAGSPKVRAFRTPSASPNLKGTKYKVHKKNQQLGEVDSARSQVWGK